MLTKFDVTVHPQSHSNPRWINILHIRLSNNRTFGGGQVDGVDASRQGSLQVMKNVVGRARTRTLSRHLKQKLLKVFQLDQKHHVLQEVALDKSCQLSGTQELGIHCVSTKLFHEFNKYLWGGLLNNYKHLLHRIYENYSDLYISFILYDT